MLGLTISKWHVITKGLRQEVDGNTHIFHGLPRLSWGWQMTEGLEALLAGAASFYMGGDESLETMVTR